MKPEDSPPNLLLQNIRPGSVDESYSAVPPEHRASEVTTIIHLMRLLGVATHNAKSLQQICETVLSEICIHMGWPVGFGYVVEPPNRLQKFTAWFRSDSERYANLQNASVQIDFEKSDSLIGRVLSTRRPVVFEDVNDHCFLRRREAQEAGLKSCLAVPILVQEKPAAILEFFHSQAISVQHFVLDTLESVASYVGMAIEHQREEKKLGALFDSAPDAEIVTDQSGMIVMVNEQSVKLFGFQQEELIGQPVEVLVPAERRTDHIQHRLNYVAAPHPRPMGSGMELTALRKDGTSIPVEISLSPIQLEQELLIACAIRDISGRKELEEKLREKERLADMGTMAAIFAHEVASPLNGISATVQLIETEIPEPTQPLLSELSLEIRRLESLLNQFRSLSSLANLKHKVINLATVIRRVLEINAAYWSGLGIRIVTEVTGDLTLSGDEEKIYQVVLNLARNAVEAMPNGGTLSISAYCRDDQVVLVISDTGGGIPEDIDIFRPVTTTKAQGAGLGLHIVRQILQAHLGVIAYRSERGTGTTFEISLPRTQRIPVIPRPT
jgi:PAS domain S-box-containing protein